MNQICIESDFQYALSKQICLKFRALVITNNILYTYIPITYTFIFCLNQLNIRYNISKHCKMTTFISKTCMIKPRVQHNAE